MDKTYRNAPPGGRLIRRQRDVVASVIAEYARGHGGNAPSLQEIADAMRISKNTVYRHVLHLEAEKRLCRQDGKIWLLTGDHH